MTQRERRVIRNEMAILVKTGMPIGEVAQKYERTISAVRQAYKEFYPSDNAHHKIGPRSPSKTIKIVGLLMRTNMSLIDIADKVGTTYQAVQNIRGELQTEGILN